MRALTPGQIFADAFRVIGPLAEGGMGVVYEVEQLATGKRRALKVMSGYDTKGDRRRRFEQEARIGSMIESEHVVEVIGAGVDVATDLPWLAMELLKGRSLAERLDQGPMTREAAVEITRQLCHALAAAHRISVVHRDLKPENVFVASPRMSDGAPLVKVLDFGIAKIVAESATATGVLGTPMWMAPEQTESKAQISPACDVWALGLIVFRMFSGKIFWLAGNEAHPKTQALLREILFEPIPSASKRAAELGGEAVPEGFDKWLARCLEREPSRRFKDAQRAWNELARIVGARPLRDPELLRSGRREPGPVSDPYAATQQAPESTPVQTLSATETLVSRRVSSRRKAMAAGFVVAVAGVGLASALLTQFGRQDAAVKPEAVAVTAVVPSSAPSSSTVLPATNAVDASAANVASDADSGVGARADVDGGLAAAVVDAGPRRGTKVTPTRPVERPKPPALVAPPSAKAPLPPPKKEPPPLL